MGYPVLSLLCIFFIFLNLQCTNSSPCTLNFSQFPYEAQSECFNVRMGSTPAPITRSCCHSVLQPVFEAMAVRANTTQTVFLNQAQAIDCTGAFQALHVRTNLSECQFQDYISPSLGSMCADDVRSIVGSLGVERFDALRSSCGELAKDGYTDDACFSCVVEYRRSLQALEGGDGGEANPPRRSVCAEALLVSLASSDSSSMNWIRGLFSCLWNEIDLPYSVPEEEHVKGKQFLFASKKLLIIIAVAAAFVVLAPILYQLTKTRLRDDSRKEMEDLSVAVMTKSLEDDYSTPFSFSGLYVFSPVEIARATDNFNTTGLIGEGSIGQVYWGLMPSGMKVAVKRINEEMKVRSFAKEISKVAKVRHPNVVSILGYCDKAEQCLVYEYCANGNLASCLLGDSESNILTWEQRLRIATGIARGLAFLRSNPYKKIIHGNLKLTNILLNEKLEPKLSDFVLSMGKWTWIGEKTDGRFEHDPAAQLNDISGFGVVLLQLLTGRKVVDFIDARPRSLINEARNVVMGGGNSCFMADPRLDGLYNPIAFQRLLLMAAFCTASSDRERPTLDEILHKLQEAHSLT